MKPIVYIETTVVSYLTARPHRDIVMAAHQQLTRDWWVGAVDRYQFVVSELVLQEAGRGDVTAAAERLEALNGISVLRTEGKSRSLAKVLLQRQLIPLVAAEDALHIAIASVSGCDYLVTWNFRHIANPTMRQKIVEACREQRYVAPVICTPEELDQEHNHAI